MKRASWTHQSLIAMGLCLLTVAAFAQTAAAETDVTAKVQVIKTSLLYDRATGTSYLDVSLKNTSTTPLVFPAQLVISSVSPATVTVSNADGATADGKPFLQFTRASNQLNPGETTTAKRLKFRNPTAVRFSHTTAVRATLPEAFGTVGASGGTVAVTDAASGLFGAWVEIPPGAVSGPVILTIRQAADLPSLPGDVGVLGVPVDLGPSGTRFSQPVTIRLPYDENELNSGDFVGHQSLRVVTYEASSDRWVPLGATSIDVSAHTISAETDHFSPFMVTGDRLTISTNGNLNSPYPPVLFVHGIQIKGAYGSAGATFGNALLFLEAAGVKTFGLTYNSWASIPESAASLANAIALVKQRTGKPVVHIIAHSMGGLLARAYVENLAVVPSDVSFPPGLEPDVSYRDDVAKLMTIGTPHRGSDLAVWGQAITPSLQDMAGVTEFLDNVNRVLMPANLPVAAVYGFEVPTIWNGALVSGDGVVAAESAQLDGLVSAGRLIWYRDRGLEGYVHMGGVAYVQGIDHPAYVLMLAFAKDADSDGVADSPDGPDTCLGTPRGTRVREDGCADNPIPPPVYTDPFTQMDFVYVAPGTFQMGDTFGDGSSVERPVHTVTLTKGFYMGKYEVTQAQWQAVMGSNPSYFQPSNGYPACPTCPVEQVSWNDIQTFIAELNQQASKSCRLPTEAEWEYAASWSADGKKKYAGTSDLAVLGNYAWYFDSAHVVNWPGGTFPVGGKLPNELGLYDMSGNVWEWVQDWWSLYTASPVIDPVGPVTGSWRVLRGGASHWDERDAQVSYRLTLDPSEYFTDRGFRLALKP